MSKIVGRIYYPEDNSWVGVYNKGELVEGGCLCCTDYSKPVENMFGTLYGVKSCKCRVVQSPFIEEVEIFGNKKEKIFIKVEHLGLIYRVLWNPTWLEDEEEDPKEKQEINLDALSDDELANLALEVRDLLQSRLNK
jgi:hypothetical protein